MLLEISIDRQQILYINTFKKQVVCYLVLLMVTHLKRVSQHWEQQSSGLLNTWKCFV